ncbi:sulfite exporter TauE/SafE family protein [Sulfurimonas sp. SAG-AH-194-I05]|nr:sulfite exporter TauE/SafE family protein [Sulfurimonas sp. SAG-AH-194-I05]MDF1875712.1 sulfite exporter TauE/SafE family protein [Sulfurimonas sp. SAG-AH-194-I05]
METLDFATLFITAFLGSVGHCIGMCGGFILAYSSAKIDQNWSKTHQSVAHFLYSIGRVTSYVFLGAIFGLLGSAFIVSLNAWGVLLIFVGILMVLMGLSLMGKLKFLTKIEVNIAQNKLYKLLFQKLFHSKTLPSFYGLGILNGLIPCGLVYIFGTFALASGSMLSGMLVMGIFGIATVPTLFSFGFIASIIQKSSFRKKALVFASILVIGYGLFSVLKGTMMLVNPDMIESKIQTMKEHQLESLK